MSLKIGIAGGLASLAGARLATNLLSAGAIIVLARLLTPEDFGIVAIAASILSVVQSCTELSLANALIQKDKVERDEIDTAWTMSLIRSLFLCLFFALLAWPLAQAYSDPVLVPVLLVSGLTGALMGLQNPLVLLVTKQMRFGPVTIFQFSQKFFSLGAAIALALLLQSYWAIIAGNALGALVSSLLTYYLVPYRPRFSLTHVSEIWKFSGWMFFKQLCETLNWRIDQLIIGLAVPKSQLGIYAMADNLAVIPSRETIHPIRQALFPGLANLRGDESALRRAHLRAQATIAMVTAPLGIGLALVAEPAVRVILGDQWLATVPFVQIIALLYSFGTFSSGLQPVSMARGQTRILFIQQAIILVIKAPLIIAGLKFGGLMGAAIARCLTEFVSMVLEFVAARMVVQAPVLKQITSHGWTIFGLLSMALGVNLISAMPFTGSFGDVSSLAVQASAGAIFYVGAIIMAWVAAGRPEGPVREILDLIAHFGLRLRRHAG